MVLIGREPQWHIRELLRVIHLPHPEVLVSVNHWRASSKTLELASKFFNPLLQLCRRLPFRHLDIKCRRQCLIRGKGDLRGKVRCLSLGVASRTCVVVCTGLESSSISRLNILYVVGVYPIPAFGSLHKCKGLSVGTHFRPIDGRTARMLVRRHVNALRCTKAHRLGNGGTTYS